jgi:hypothetical protein
MPATQIPAPRRDAVAAWLLQVYRESKRLADELDPTRRNHVDAVIHIDAIATNASRAYRHLTGSHIHTVKGDC